MGVFRKQSGQPLNRWEEPEATRSILRATGSNWEQLGVTWEERQLLHTNLNAKTYVLNFKTAL